MEEWWHEVVDLVASGRTAEAVELTRDEALAGSLAAQVRIARFGEEAGVSREEADQMISRAESLVEPADATCQWALFGAYEASLGACQYDEKARRALKHLQAYAEATEDPQATYAVAVRYGQGTIGTEPDAMQVLSWMRRAAKLGHPMGEQFLLRSERDASQETPPK
jgi:TPR repeat protein